MPNILQAVDFMVKTALDNKHGYDQKNRNGPDYDCSSLVATALHDSGFNVNPHSWTGNLESQLRANDFYDCKPPWKAGDIHLKTGKHVVMSVSTEQIAHASINELGKTTGGKTGDQTGKEICIRTYYDYKGGWDVHLRYLGVNTGGDSVRKSVDTLARECISGIHGNGFARRVKIEKMGYEYEPVRLRVNEILNGKNKTVEEVARECIKGLHGNGATRKHRVEQMGLDYEEVRKLVNQILKGVK